MDFFFFFFPTQSARLFYNRDFHLAQTWWIWRGMPGLLRGVSGLQPLWPWLSVNVLNRGTSRQCGIRWLAELSRCVFVCHVLLASARLPRFCTLRLSLTSFHFPLVPPLWTWRHKLEAKEDKSNSIHPRTMTIKWNQISSVLIYALAVLTVVLNTICII